jgi:hypothetical protein
VIEYCKDVHGPSLGSFCYVDPVIGCYEGNPCQLVDIMPGKLHSSTRLLSLRSSVSLAAGALRCS